MQRLQTRPQFQATMSGGTISRTEHFALHRLVLTAAQLDALKCHAGDKVRLVRLCAEEKTV